jgi:DNA-binding NtrC family response regulator
MAKKVLIVEDDAAVHSLCSRIVKSLGLEALVAEDSEKALEFLNSEDIGVAFLDFDLKDGPTGDLVAKAARGLNVPSVIISSNADREEKFNRYLPVAYLQKPFNLDAFESYVKKYCL